MAEIHSMRVSHELHTHDYDGHLGINKSYKSSSKRTNCAYYEGNLKGGN